MYEYDVPVPHAAALFNVLTVCRQMYREARTMPFSCNTWEALWRCKYQSTTHRVKIRWYDLRGTLEKNLKSVINWFQFQDYLKREEDMDDEQEYW